MMSTHLQFQTPNIPRLILDCAKTQMRWPGQLALWFPGSIPSLIEANDGQVASGAPPLAEEQADAGTEDDGQQIGEHEQGQHFTEDSLADHSGVSKRHIGFARLAAVLEVTCRHRRVRPATPVP